MERLRGLKMGVLVSDGAGGIFGKGSIKIAEGIVA
jgi:hypothetical protein